MTSSLQWPWVGALFLIGNVLAWYGFGKPVVCWLLSSAILLWFGFARFRLLQLAYVAGFLWTLCYGYLFDISSLLIVTSKTTALVEGQINTLESYRFEQQRYIISIDKINHQQVPSQKVLINCFHDCPRLRAGESWQLVVKLQSPSGRFNPTGYDFERWLFSRHIAATGYLLKSNRNIKLSASTGIAGYRTALKQKLSDTFGDDIVFSSLCALLLGDRSELTDKQIQHLADSGLSHLVAISGLHVSLAMIPGMILGGLVWYSGICKSGISRQSMQWTGASVTSFVFSLMAGFGLPAQRALIMVLVLAITHFSGKRSSSIQRIGFALLVMLILQPRASLDLSFWLSFTVTSLIVWGTSIRLNSTTWHLLYLQGFLAVFLYAMQVYIFHQYSMTSLLHNLWAIPYISLILLPVAMIWVVMDYLSILTLAEILIHLVGFLTYYFWYLILLTDSVTSRLVISQTTDVLLIVLIVFVSLLSWFAYDVKGRLVAIVMLYLLHRPVMNDEELTLTVLDVGQGTGILIATSNQLILYDTGYGNEEYQLISSVLPQWMRERGYSEINYLIISHSDADHSGASQWLLKNIPISAIISNEKYDDSFSPGHYSCQQGLQWQLNEMQLELLWPAQQPIQQTSNNDSCVVLISYGGRRVLLTGDIEHAVESELVKSYPGLQVDIMTVPHHGSRTSSSKTLLEQLAPEIALNSSGYLNRFGFPHSEVTRRYKEQGIEFYDTATNGAIELTITPEGRINLRPSRQQNPALWRRN